MAELANTGRATTRILFLVTTLGLGGIETFVLRVAGQLSRSGFSIHVWVLSNSTDALLLEKLKTVATVRILGVRPPLGLVWRPRAPCSLGNFDLIFCSGRNTLLFAAVNNASRVPLRVVTGVYHQAEYIPSRPVLRDRVAAKLFNALPVSNVVFCTDGCRDDHASHFGTHFLSSSVMPLYLDVPRTHCVVRPVLDVLHMLSIGRLVEFKTYNLQALHAIYELRQRGMKVCWTVVGDGPMKNKMIQLAAELQISDQVRFLGERPYDQLEAYYLACDVYLGAGTTILQAASYGCVVICSVDGEKSWNTSGFLHDRVGVVHSDLVASDALTPLPGVLSSFYLADSSARKSWSLQSRAIVSGYTLDHAGGAFERLIASAQPVNISLNFFFVLHDYLSVFVWAAFCLLRGDRVRADKAG